MAKKKILVVDDDAGVRLTIRKFLEFSNIATFVVTEAASGEECLETIAANDPFDLILLDIEMGEMSGYDVCRELRDKDHTEPIVFVTSHANVEHRVQGRAAGGDSFLAKPIRQAPLLSLVKLFLEATRHR